MSSLVPILMWAGFLAVWFALMKIILVVNRRVTKRALLRSPRLDAKSMAALLYLYFGGKIFFRSRWFPKRTLAGTVYEEVPFILILGSDIFVLEVRPYPGLLHNTNADVWRITPPSGYTKKKEIRIDNPIQLGKDRAAILRDLLDVFDLPFQANVESMVILTDKSHRCENPEQEGLYTVPEALAYLSRFAPKSKRERKRMKKRSRPIFGLFERYSLSQKRAIAKNNKKRLKKK